MQLMHKDIVVADIDVSKNICEIHRPELMPLELMGVDFNKTPVHQVVNAFIASRQHSLSKENDKIVSERLGQSESKSVDLLKRSVIFYCTSMTDCIWLKQPGQDKEWKDVNPRTNHLRDICTLKDKETHKPLLKIQSEIIDKGKDARVQDGSSAHVWKESSNPTDTKEFYKQSNDKNCADTKAELLASKLLDCMNINHVKYEKVSERTCKSENIANEEQSVVPMTAIYSYCSKNHVSFQELIHETDYSNYCKMKLFDYIVDNRDRTDNNCGFLRDNKTGELIGLQPIMDHDNAFGNSHKKEREPSESDLQKWAKNANLKINEEQFKRILLAAGHDKYMDCMQRMERAGICEKKELTFTQKLTNDVRSMYVIKPEYKCEDPEKYIDQPACSFNPATKEYCYEEIIEENIERNDDFRQYIEEQNRKVQEMNYEKANEKDKDDLER